MPQLQLNSTHWEKIFNEMNICIWSVDARTMKTLHISSSCQQVLGYSQHELTENAFLWEEMLHPNDKEHVLNQLRSIKTGQSAKLEYRIRTYNGDCKWVSDLITPFLRGPQPIVPYIMIAS